MSNPSKVHTLKIEEKYWDSILCGQKSCEVRKHDRDFQAGDFIAFEVLRENGESILADKFKYLITHVLKGGQYGIESDYCVLSLERK